LQNGRQLQVYEMKKKGKKSKKLKRKALKNTQNIQKHFFNI